MNIVNPEYTVESIVERMRKASAERQPVKPLMAAGDSVINTSGEPTYLPNPDIKPINFQPDFQIQDEYHVNDLLKFTDESFVENAYQAILKRSADPVGRDTFLEALRSGQLNKIDVLARLRYSKEGRAEAVRLKGLFVPAALRTFYRVPLAGYVLNLSVALLRLPSILKSQREFEAHMFAHEEILVRHMNHIGQSLINEAHAVAAAQQQLVHQMKQQDAQIISEQANTHEVLLTRIAEFNSYIEERINDESAERQDEVSRLRTDVQTAREDVTRTFSETMAELTNLRTELLAQLSLYTQRERRTSAELSLQSEQLARILDQAKREPSFAPRAEVGADNTALLDAFFAAFNDHFRGTREEIKERLRVYLPFLASDSTLVDVGCGRGEWLELLRDEGVAATGVELNTVLAEACRERGLNVVEQDLFAYLATLPNESVGTVSAFHVVEHLPVEQVVSFLNEAMRVLKPGGMLMLETPNPRNVLVGSCNFYFDPTHRNPLPSEVLQLMVETRGFEPLQVLPLNPSDAMPVPGDSEIVNRFNEYFYGPMDYGLIARRP